MGPSTGVIPGQTQENVSLGEGFDTGGQYLKLIEEEEEAVSALKIQGRSLYFM
jgi:hypothetical protein